jgi:hypothetical protein
MKFRFFCPAPLEGYPLHPLLSFRFSDQAPWRGVFTEGLPPSYFEHEAEFVDDIQEAQAVILPHNFRSLDSRSQEYIKAHAETAEKRGIRLYIFSFGDLHDDLHFDSRVYVFRLSTYKSIKQPHDIIVPTTVAHFEESEITFRPHADVPLISFCGYAGFKTAKQWARYVLKNWYWNFRAVTQPVLLARKQGIYWRRKAMRVLKNSPLVKTNFIIRRSFSGAMSTIEYAPEVGRKEFIKSIQEADFVLTPKGDGNYSNRFLETLSLARIPVLVDTDTVLPLEEVIPYEKFVVRVPIQEIKKTPEYIKRFYDELSPEEWQSRQRLARQMFEAYLRQDKFFKYYFEHNTRTV